MARGKHCLVCLSDTVHPTVEGGLKCTECGNDPATLSLLVFGYCVNERCPSSELGYYSPFSCVRCESEIRRVQRTEEEILEAIEYARAISTRQYRRRIGRVDPALKVGIRHG